MREAVEAWGACFDALREVEDARTRQVQIERSRRPVQAKRRLIDMLEHERVQSERDLELCFLELLTVCGMVDDEWRDARIKNARLRSVALRLIENV